MTPKQEDTATEQNFVNTLADYTDILQNSPKRPSSLKPTITKNVQ